MFCFFKCKVKDERRPYLKKTKKTLQLTFFTLLYSFEERKIEWVQRLKYGAVLKRIIRTVILPYPSSCHTAKGHKVPPPKPIVIREPGTKVDFTVFELNFSVIFLSWFKIVF